MKPNGSYCIFSGTRVSESTMEIVYPRLNFDPMQKKKKVCRGGGGKCERSSVKAAEAVSVDLWVFFSSNMFLVRSLPRDCGASLR